MNDILDKIAKQAQHTISSGYYESQSRREKKTFSLGGSIEHCRGNAVITEIKTKSPSNGQLVEKVDIVHVAKEMVINGSVGISVLTEPKYFNGELNNLRKVRESIYNPILMKDFIINTVQLSAAEKNGADAILLIKALFNRGYSEYSLDEMISQAHKKGLEVLLETHTLDEFNESMDSKADLIGINNRDLGSMNVSLKTTEEIMKKARNITKPVVSESGIKGIQDIIYLRSHRVNAFLVGTTLMRSNNLGKTVKELVQG